MTSPETSRIGIFGGTFNPVHNGHLFLAEEALAAASLDRVVFIPNRRPPHKDSPEVDAEIRYDMLKAATSEVPLFEVSRVELDRDGRSYTVDTLHSFPQQQELVFICGADAFLVDWYQLEQVMTRLSTLLIANRAGFAFEIPEQLKALPKELQAKIQLLDFPDICISSSNIRGRIRNQNPFRFLIPEPVYRIITKSGLYQQSGKIEERQLKQHAD